MTYALRFENIIDAPAVNICEAVRVDENYLKNPGDAEDQLKKEMLATVGSSEVQLPNQCIKTGGAVSPFILEGRHAGVGDLTFIARRNGIEIARSAVRLELKPIAAFWEKYVVTTTTSTGDEVQPEAIQFGQPSYKPGNDEYVLFVHGMGMGGADDDGWQKDRWAETVFKRLWWLGYRGRVGGFQWPCLGFTAYDQGELRAWRSGEALAKLLEQLNNSHPGQVRVIAHSMGNVVTGEAIKRAPSQSVHTYIAAQAAIPAHCYDNGVSPYISWESANTPNVYGFYPWGFDERRPERTGVAYFAEISSRVVRGNLLNYYNIRDWALSKWEINNNIKPDNLINNYYYKDSDGDIDTYNYIWDRFYHLGFSSEKILHFPEEPAASKDDRFEIFAYCSQSRSKALGATAPYNGSNRQLIAFNCINLELDPYKFDSWHYSHSREFRSNIIKERWFWKSAGYDFKLNGKNFINRFN